MTHAGPPQGNFAIDGAEVQAVYLRMAVKKEQHQNCAAASLTAIKSRTVGAKNSSADSIHHTSTKADYCTVRQRP